MAATRHRLNLHIGEANTTPRRQAEFREHRRCRCAHDRDLSIVGNRRGRCSGNSAEVCPGRMFTVYTLSEPVPQLRQRYTTDIRPPPAPRR